MHNLRRRARRTAPRSPPGVGAAHSAAQAYGVAPPGRTVTLRGGIYINIIVKSPLGVLCLQIAFRRTMYKSPSGVYMPAQHLSRLHNDYGSAVTVICAYSGLVEVLTAELLFTDLFTKSWIFSFNIKFFYPRFPNQIYATKKSQFETYRQIFCSKIYAPLRIRIYVLCLCHSKLKRKIDSIELRRWVIL